MQKIILASTSPRRKELLEKLGLPFEIIPSDYEEDMNLDMHPLELAKFLSLGKAQAVAGKNVSSLVIGADTFVALGEKLLGKPKNIEEAKNMLREISGQMVSVITGFTLIDSDTGQTVSEVVETKIYIKKLSDEEIDNYIKTGEPLDKAGAFAIQGVGAVFIEKIEGDFLATVGLPLFALANRLKEFGIKVL